MKKSRTKNNHCLYETMKKRSKRPVYTADGQGLLFSWEDIELSNDLDLLRMVIDTLASITSFRKLIKFLKEERGRGRNDNPVDAMFNAVVAMILFNHESVASFIRELRRNRELVQVIGFDPMRVRRKKGKLEEDESIEAYVPSRHAMYRFIRKLMEYDDLVEEIFNEMVGRLAMKLPEFGNVLSIDSKALKSHGKSGGKKSKGDGRSENDANWGVKRYQVIEKNNVKFKELKRWFGFKLHVLIDAKYEIPVAYEVTKASVSDVSQSTVLIEKLKKNNPEVLGQAKVLTGDRGYDSGQLNLELYRNYGIKPVIRTRKMWREQESKPVFDDRADNFIYDESGRVFCVSPVEEKGKIVHREMAFVGFEKDRNTLKYRCPAAAYGFECKGRAQCEAKANIKSNFGRTIRIPLTKDHRIFTPIARSSYKWKTLYKTRTSVERVNYRHDLLFQEERAFVRGIKKMRLMSGLGLLVMVGLSLSWVQKGELENIRKVRLVA